ncbi:hypothetical protein C8R44DRAFT_733182 [Mycena epipterygia]|nr:hypothetical protein C8R44DRAFT_733182 [Mycena epipterygia]
MDIIPMLKVSDSTIITAATGSATVHLSGERIQFCVCCRKKCGLTPTLQGSQGLLTAVKLTEMEGSGNNGGRQLHGRERAVDQWVWDAPFPLVCVVEVIPLCAGGAPLHGVSLS